jgi:hypothetical protein
MNPYSAPAVAVSPARIPSLPLEVEIVGFVPFVDGAA